jgi:hypothetical protein
MDIHYAAAQVDNLESSTFLDCLLRLLHISHGTLAALAAQDDIKQL